MTQRKALLSVYDKEGIVEFARRLIELDWEIISSGGTARVLAEAGVPVTDVAQITGMPPILGHRVVTLAPQIHGGLLATEAMREELGRYKLPWIDLVCVDLYPLAQTSTAPGATIETITEMTDIGGRALLLSAAKGRRIVISNTIQREQVLTWLESGEPEAVRFRESLAMSAEAVVSAYSMESSTQIARHLLGVGPSS